MEITEIEPEKKIVLSKFNFSCDEIDDSIPLPLPQALNFFLLISGKPASGKTSLILNLLCKKNKNYNSKFNRIYVFSPSLLTMKDDPFGELPQDQLFTELTPINLQKAMDDIAGSGEKVLFLLDDVVNDMRNTGVLTLLNKMLMNRRHLTGAGGSVSFIITTQIYNKIPITLRKTATQVILYSTKNKKEIDTIFDELILIPKEEYYQILKYCFDKQYNFIFIDINKSHDRMFHKCFNELNFKIKSEQSDERK
tara:strand:- start:532 stop:1287 length:756 start_codon:yes stop_codon:yes gene_type:complete